MDFQHVLDDASLGLSSKIKMSLECFLKEGRFTLATAESLTGGYLSYSLKALSTLPYYLGGVVCEHALSFVHFCGLSGSDYQTYMTKHQHLASLMNQRLFAITKADICISTTGYIQEKSSPCKAEVFASFLIKGKEKIKTCTHTGTGFSIPIQATQSILGYLSFILAAYKDHSLQGG